MKQKKDDIAASVMTIEANLKNEYSCGKQDPKERTASAWKVRRGRRPGELKNSSSLLRIG